MKQFTVAVSMDSDADVLYACLNRYDQGSHTGVYAEILRTHGNRLELKWSGPDDLNHINEINWTMEIAQIISKFIINHMESNILRTILLRKNIAYNEHEIREMIQYCKQLLFDTEAGLDSLEHSRLGTICHQLYLYLQTYSHLNIEGFVQFRLRRYMNDLQLIVDDAHHEFVLNEQYQEFIALLKYFVYFQDAKIPEVHLIHLGDNKFQLLDGELQQLDISDSKDVIVETVDRELNYEDMVVSALISASPKKIHIHTRDPETQAIKTIQQIFEGRTWICTCCNLCKPSLGEWKAERLT